MHNGFEFIIAPLVLLVFFIGFIICLCTLIKCCQGIEEQQLREQNSMKYQNRIRSHYRQPLVQNSEEHNLRDLSSSERGNQSGLRSPQQQPLIQPTSVDLPNSASPIVVPPYPVEPRHPTPQTSGPPPVGFATNQPPYPTHTPMGMPGPYPPTIAPYPPTVPTYPVGSQLGSTPYPPTTDSPLPPSYQEAVGQPAPPSIRESYIKQAPYNPNY